MVSGEGSCGTKCLSAVLSIDREVAVIGLGFVSLYSRFIYALCFMSLDVHSAQCTVHTLQFTVYLQRSVKDACVCGRLPEDRITNSMI